MEFLTYVLVAFAGTVIVNVLSSEVYAKMRALADWTLRIAVQLLPAELRAIREEEWAAHARDEKGNLSKLAHAVGCVWAALVLRDEFEKYSEKPFSEKSRTYRWITYFYFVLDCWKQSVIYWYFFPLYIALSIYDTMHGTKKAEDWENYFMRAYYKRIDGFKKD